MTNKLVILVYCLTLIIVLVKSNGQVEELDGIDFKKKVIDSNDLWLIKFYGKENENDKELTEKWNKLSKSVTGMVKVGQINLLKQSKIGEQFGIKENLSIYIFSSDRLTPSRLDPSSSIEDMVKLVSEKLKDLFTSRLNSNKEKEKDNINEEKVKDNNSNQNDSNKKQENSNNNNNKNNNNNSNNNNKEDNNNSEKNDVSSEEYNKEYKRKYPNSNVVELNDANFKELVYNSNELWLVEFFAPWCHHCKILEPEWEKLAKIMKNSAKVARVNSVDNPEITNQFGINAYPSINIYPPGEKDDSKVIKYNSHERTAENIASYTYKLLEKYGFTPVVQQLTNHSQYEEECLNSGVTCMIAFFSNLYDSNAEERNKYLEIFNKSVMSARGSPINFLWAQGGDFYEFEEKLGMSFGYPAVLVINHSKGKYAFMKESYDFENMKAYVGRILIGRESLYDTPKSIPKLNSVEKWDGKDLKISGDDL